MRSSSAEAAYFAAALDSGIHLLLAFAIVDVLPAATPKDESLLSEHPPSRQYATQFFPTSFACFLARLALLRSSTSSSSQQACATPREAVRRTECAGDSNRSPSITRRTSF